MQTTIYPNVFPEHWASDWGEDEYGLWMGFSIKNVQYNFRWIQPGHFLMGSPETECGREINEVQHDVLISKGYWLAENTVTQALWKAVMGYNPSEFKGDRRPVEQVSWEDTQLFINKLNQDNEALQLCLPTEAQWEFACRANTESPFSFGHQLQTSDANFDGAQPYQENPLSESRKEVVNVKTFPANPWGLYEMHGNVSEWCEDWYGDYYLDNKLDPKGKNQGSNRVLRGGAWFQGGRYLRAASRIGTPPDNRLLNIGFRLARKSLDEKTFISVRTARM
ncbi:MAG: formylglycine-generating enzyme family protein [Cocleimonas sp.]|nr:formylglycine-generating enzyme family protein [Cocleimonas sp.]